MSLEKRIERLEAARKETLFAVFYPGDERLVEGMDPDTWQAMHPSTELVCFCIEYEGDDEQPGD